jgi:hypothetical protein
MKGFAGAMQGTFLAVPTVQVHWLSVDRLRVGWAVSVAWLRWEAGVEWVTGSGRRLFGQD